ncbi:MAG: type II toxin-antitoxin system VapC family toxin [bacterium]|nr:type II toxin-antitoxin system VapC family toxin [bacterium]
MYALDTNTLIYFFKGMGNVAERLIEQRSSQIAIPTVVVYELEVGLAKSSSPKKRRSQLKTLLDRVKILPLGLDEAQTAGRVRARLEQKGTPIGLLDSLIAGTALHHGAILVTHNVRELGRVRGLRVVDWY